MRNQRISFSSVIPGAGTNAGSASAPEPHGCNRSNEALNAWTQRSQTNHATRSLIRGHSSCSIQRRQAASTFAREERSAASIFATTISHSVDFVKSGLRTSRSACSALQSWCHSGHVFIATQHSARAPEAQA